MGRPLPGGPPRRPLPILAHSSRPAGSTTYLVRCWANSALRNAAQLRSSGPTAPAPPRTHKRDAEERRPLMWPRYRRARESPLKSIDTTSVSMIAAFIEKGLGAEPSWRHGAKHGRESRRPTHLRWMDAQAEYQTPSPGRPPAMLRVPRTRVVSEFRLDGFARLPIHGFQDSIPPPADSAAGES